MNATATPVLEEEATTCFICGKRIVDGHWFARFRQNSRLIIFCRPLCVEVFLQQSESANPDWPVPRTRED